MEQRFPYSHGPRPCEIRMSAYLAKTVRSRDMERTILVLGGFARLFRHTLSTCVPWYRTAQRNVQYCFWFSEYLRCHVPDQHHQREAVWIQLCVYHCCKVAEKEPIPETHRIFCCLTLLKAHFHHSLRKISTTLPL